MSSLAFTAPVYSISLQKDCPLQKPPSEFDQTWDAAIRLLQTRGYIVDQQEKHEGKHSFIVGHHTRDMSHRIFVFVCQHEAVDALLIQRMSQMMQQQSIQKLIVVTKDTPLHIETQMAVLTHYIANYHEIEILKQSTLLQFGRHAPVPSRYLCAACGQEGDHWIMDCEYNSIIQIMRRVTRYLLDVESEVFTHPTILQLFQWVLCSMLNAIQTLFPDLSILTHVIYEEVVEISKKIPDGHVTKDEQKVEMVHSLKDETVDEDEDDDVVSGSEL